MNALQQQSLLEAMEQQSVTIAKAGIVCTLNSRTTVIAAANPTSGRVRKPLNTNIRPNLLSRFDLIFVLVDKPDPEVDMKLSEFIMAQQRGNTDRESCYTPTTLGSSIFAMPSQKEIVPIQLLSKYIAYARRYVNVKLSSECATNLIEPYFIDLRKRLPAINIRHLETIIRLTKARARLELRELTNERDVQDAIHIFEYSIKQSNETYCAVLTQFNSGKCTSAKKTKRFIESLRHQARSNKSFTFSVGDLKQIAETMCGMDEDSSNVLIQKLNETGYLLKKSRGVFELVNEDGL
ncbi:hypothetical protein ACOME3_005646 [Neoechinorhynchus agilis]